MTHTLFPPALLQGYKDFKTTRFTREQERYRELAERGQTPETLIIACCDSRAAPEMIFNAAPGEIFVVRNVANLVPPYAPSGQHHGTSAALEFAVQALKVKNIVVLGHGRCGGIHAALNPESEPLSPGDFIGKWMELLAPAAIAVGSEKNLSDTERHTRLERVSIRNSLKNLMSFPCVSILAERGRLQLFGAWFDIFSGELWILDPDLDDFVPVPAS